MNYSSSATITISTGHTIDANEWCGSQPHGHRYTITVTWDREGFPATDHAIWSITRQKLLDLGLELKDRDLGKMIGAAVPNVFGLASFVMDRMSPTVPVIKVEVREDDDPVAIIERTRE